MTADAEYQSSSGLFGYIIVNDDASFGEVLRHKSWPGFLHVYAYGEDNVTFINLYISDASAIDLRDKLIAKLAQEAESDATS